MKEKEEAKMEEKPATSPVPDTQGKLTLGFNSDEF